ERFPFVARDAAITARIDAVEPSTNHAGHAQVGRGVRPVEVVAGDDAIAVAIKTVEQSARPLELLRRDAAIVIDIEAGRQPLPAVASLPWMNPALARPHLRAAGDGRQHLHDFALAQSLHHSENPISIEQRIEVVALRMSLGLWFRGAWWRRGGRS